MYLILAKEKKFYEGRKLREFTFKQLNAYGQDWMQEYGVCQEQIARLFNFLDTKNIGSVHKSNLITCLLEDPKSRSIVRASRRLHPLLRYRTDLKTVRTLRRDRRGKMSYDQFCQFCASWQYDAEEQAWNITSLGWLFNKLD